MDQNQIKAIERFVNSRRKALRQDVETRLHGYGIQPSGELLPESSLEHLSDIERQTADQLRQRFDHLSASMKPAEAFSTVVREQAFTILNRMVTLRMAEARGMILPSVSGGMESEGFQLFLQSCDQKSIGLYAWYRNYLLALFDELSLELPVLFDRFRGEGLIFPRQDTCTVHAIIHIYVDPGFLSALYRHVRQLHSRLL